MPATMGRLPGRRWRVSTVDLCMIALEDQPARWLVLTGPWKGEFPHPPDMTANHHVLIPLRNQKENHV